MSAVARTASTFTPAKDPKVLISKSLQRIQRRHAQGVVVLMGLGVVLAAGLLVAGPPIDGRDLVIFLACFVMVGIGSSVGYHRHFTHASFKAHTGVRVALAILGSMAAQGNVVFWVSLHRRHHECSDKAGDPHSPYVLDTGQPHASRWRGLWHSYIGWTFGHEVPNSAHYARDLLRDRPIRKVNELYFLWVVLGLAIPAALGGVLHGSGTGALAGLVWGGLIRILLWHHVIWYITSLAHVVGRRDYVSDDGSTNNRWLALPTLGESLHNNHHAFPAAALLDFRRGELDPSAWVIRALSALGLAHDVRRPTPAMQDRLRIAR